ncbi:MAG: type IV secretion system DNA-binding domain-containing protein [Candidatus Peribacteraceae bacterium]|nr:type IV secretion system DNA-binding domain-containing protein [Candidatus Peribacteraceae bacterium]
MPKAQKEVLLRIRPSLPDPDESSAARGPLMMESVLSAIHSIRKGYGPVSFEVATCEGKIALYVRSSERAAALVESQLYAQYPDAEIEQIPSQTLDAREGEKVFSSELVLTGPEVYPIKRYPQFIDLASRQHVDTIAGITSALVRYKGPMRGHVQFVLQPVGPRYRRRALAFIPFLRRGLPKHSPVYAVFFSKIHLAKGWRRWALFPLDMLLGGWRTWFSRPTLSFMSGAEESTDDPDEEARAGMRTHDREDPETAAVDKVNRLLFLSTIRVSVVARVAETAAAEAKVEEIASSFRQFTLPQCNGFAPRPVRVLSALPSGLAARPFVLSVEEAATLWHVPNILVKTPNFDWVVSKKLEPPVDLPVVSEAEPDLTVLGEAVFRAERQKFGIRTDDRRRHMYIIGKTGMGKSTLLENMIFSDIHAGKGVAVIDPHGDLVEATLRFIPASRSNDVILFDPCDREFPVSFNMLNCPDPAQQELVASGLMSIFKKLWPEAFSGRMEYILRNALLALIEAENNSMLGIMRIFVDDAFRGKILEHVKNHLVKSFWEDEYTGWSDKYRTEAIAAIQNKIGQLLSAPLIRNIVGQVQSKVDIRHAMDTGKIILMNLSKGKLGEDNSAFLGSMMVTKFQLDAMSRADVPEKERKDFYLYVDEFQNFATESFATILSEARKYRLNLTMANQYVNQLIIGDKSTQLRDAVFGNVGSLTCFQVGSDDAEPLSEQFEEMVLPKDILSLPKYHAYMRLMVQGIPSKPFSVSTLPPPVFEQDAKRVEIIRKLSRERYAERVTAVEDKITKWIASGRTAQKGAKVNEKAKEKEEEELKKAKKKGMTLEQYRAWRDRELCVNEFNALRKKEFLGETLTVSEKESMERFRRQLEATGGVPPPSKTLLQAKEAAVKKA